MGYLFDWPISQGTTLQVPPALSTPYRLVLGNVQSHLGFEFKAL
jgi:hypothetical protein